MHVCMHACMHAMYVCMYVCMHVCMHAMYVCMQADTHAYKQARTHARTHAVVTERIVAAMPTIAISEVQGQREHHTNCLFKHNRDRRARGCVWDFRMRERSITREACAKVFALSLIHI